MLSHSTWRDEKSVVRWRTEGEHHAVQEKGRFKIFQDYHLRVGDVFADTDGMPLIGHQGLFQTSESGPGQQDGDQEQHADHASGSPMSDDPLLGVRATILLRIDWLSGLIGALLW